MSVFPDGVRADPARLSSRNSTFTTLNYGDSGQQTGKMFIQPSAAEPVLRMRKNAKANIPIVEMHVCEISAVFRRLLDWEDVYFEDITEVKRRIKVEGARAFTYPRISLALSGIQTRPGDVNARAMANSGITSYTQSPVQAVAYEHRFIPADFSFRVAYFYDDYPSAVQVMTDVGFLAGQRLLRYNVMLESFEHDVSMLFDPGLSIGSIDHADDGPVGTLEFSFTLSSGLSDVDRRPIVEDTANRRAGGLITQFDIEGTRLTNERMGDETTDPFKRFQEIRQESAGL